MSRENVDLGELLDNIDMESYFDKEGVDYRVTHGSSGTQLNVKECPVCGSRKWKVFLNSDSGLGNCFAGDHPADENFNKWNFIKAWSGMESARDLIQHIQQAAKEMGWRPRRVESAKVELERPDLVMPESHAIPVNGMNLKYLSDRNIDTDTAKYFNLRYSHKGVFWYKGHGGDFQFQDYRERVLIPIFDLEGQLASFQGRDIKGTSEKKYLFPPGFSSTGKLVYNAHNVVGLEHVIVNEGVFDVMATKIAMDEDMDLRDIGVVGSFGKHLSVKSAEGEDQLNKFIQLKEKGLKTVTFMWDGESSAIVAACTAGQAVKALGLDVRIAILPPGKDPNEVPPSVVRKAYWEAMPLNTKTIIKLRLMG